MSNGIASGVPPAGGGAGGVAAAGAGAGAGAGACANVGEIITATAQAATVIETMERLKSSRLKSVFIVGAMLISQNAAPMPSCLGPGQGLSATPSIPYYSDGEIRNCSGDHT